MPLVLGEWAEGAWPFQRRVHEEGIAGVKCDAAIRPSGRQALPVQLSPGDLHIDGEVFSNGLHFEIGIPSLGSASEFDRSVGEPVSHEVHHRNFYNIRQRCRLFR
jgi:hypothetical protein